MTMTIPRFQAARCLFLRPGAPSQLPIGIYPVSPVALELSASHRSFSNGSKTKFRPQRRPNPNYRPIIPRFVKPKGPRPDSEMESPIKQIVKLNKLTGLYEPNAEYGPMAKGALQHLAKLRLEREREFFNIEEQLRLADYFTSASGSTEDLVGERRALAVDIKDELERERYLTKLDKYIDKARIEELDLDDFDFDDSKNMEDEVDENGDISDEKLERLAADEDSSVEEVNDDMDGESISLRYHIQSTRCT
ncbi:MAG: hypothetical protein M1113_05795 [Candidatus Thermoplasmatota archaeon]|nr:hypothetical protein [Candidatus Thermoplasmatota archaeon]